MLGFSVALPEDAGIAEVQEHLAKLVELLMSGVHDWHRPFGEKGPCHLG